MMLTTNPVDIIRMAPPKANCKKEKKFDFIFALTIEIKRDPKYLVVWIENLKKWISNGQEIRSYK